VTTFDRYLLAKYFHIVAVFLIATIGLFAVVDGFTNLDEFQKKVGGKEQAAVAIFLRLGKYYLYQSALIVDTAGPTIMVMAAMCVLALMLRQGEIHPLLAAGVPTYRATAFLGFGVLFVNALLAVNQEVILPRIAPHLQGRHGELADEAQAVQPQYDPQSKIYVSGTGIIPGQRRLENAEFVPPFPLLVTDYVPLKGDFAIYYPEGPEGSKVSPAGWLVKNVSPTIEQIPLTDAGRSVIIPQANGQDVFILTALTFDQLNRQASNPRLVGTPDLIRRLQQPAGTQSSRSKLLVHLHERLTRPVLTLIGLYLVIPLIVRKERMSVLQQVTNIAACVAVLGVVFGACLGLQFVGGMGLLRPDQAVWWPLVGAGGIAAWLTGVVRT
jgi:lipopolysaccharide export system permease protein